jgi:hypothetical protein
MATQATKLPGVERPPVDNYPSLLRGSRKKINPRLVSTLGQLGGRSEAILSIDLLCDKGEFREVDRIVRERIQEMMLPSLMRKKEKDSMAIVKYGLKKLHDLDKMWAISMKTAYEIFCFPDADIKLYYKALLV